MRTLTTMLLLSMTATAQTSSKPVQTTEVEQLKIKVLQQQLQIQQLQSKVMECQEQIVRDGLEQQVEAIKKAHGFNDTVHLNYTTGQLEDTLPEKKP